MHPEGKLTLDLKLELGESLHLTDEAPGLWQVLSTGSWHGRCSGDIKSVDSLRLVR